MSIEGIGGRWDVHFGGGMKLTRFQIALLGVAIGLASLAAARVMTVRLQALKADVFGWHSDD